MVGKIYAVALSPDGGTIAAGGWTSPGLGTRIYLFERATGREIGRIGGLPNVIYYLAFSPDGSKLAAAIWGANGVRLFDALSLHEIAADKNYGSDSYGLAFAPDGRIATTSWDGNIRLYGPSLDEPKSVLAPDGKRPYGIAFSSDGGRIAIGYNDATQVTVLDGHTLRKLVAPNTSGVDNGNLVSVAWSSDGGRLYAGGEWDRDGSNPLRAWADGGSGVAQDYLLTQNAIFDLRRLTDERLAVAAADPRVVMIDRSGSVIWQAAPRTADFRSHGDQIADQP